VTYIISDDIILNGSPANFVRMRPLHIFLLLCASFIVYSLTIYLRPLSQTSDRMSPAAAEGRLVWQKYNCQSCHQLYGLGGYLGPDLTNVTSAPGKDSEYLKAVIASGNGVMPAFDLSDEEETQVIAFLKSADSSGHADPRSFRATFTGDIEPAR
jgi:nitric oxide reductase subunit C